jgi:hypothetical protein
MHLEESLNLRMMEKLINRGKSSKVPLSSFRFHILQLPCSEQNGNDLLGIGDPAEVGFHARVCYGQFGNFQKIIFGDVDL